MKLYLPTKIYNEKNCVENHSRELAALGTKALVVTGRHSSRINGSLEDVMSALERENIPYIVFDGIEENPSVESVMQAGNIGAGEQVDFVIGVGGGSPMDAAKAVALAVANPDMDKEQFYRKEGTAAQGKLCPAVPVAEVPTTAGSGSEVTPYAILTRTVLPDILLTTMPDLGGKNVLPHLGKRKKQSISHLIYPELALVDITYLQTVGRDNCIHTAIDTLAHLIESHLNTNSTGYSRIYSEMGLRTWAKLKDALLRYEIGEEERQRLMHACTLGGMAIAHTGTSIPHGLSYAVTCEMGIPHGKAAGIFLPGYLRNYGSQDEVMKVLGLLDFGGVQTFSEFIRELLGEVPIEEELWESMVDELLDNPVKLRNHPFMVDKEKLKRFKL